MKVLKQVPVQLKVLKHAGTGPTEALQKCKLMDNNEYLLLLSQLRSSSMKEEAERNWEWFWLVSFV